MFKNADAHVKVVEALSQKNKGLTKKEISEATKLPENGTLTKILDNLSNSGFIRPYNYYGNKKKQMTYQLADYYTLFYFRFLKDQNGKDENYWQNTLDNPAKRAWCGYSFEQVCKDHIDKIKDKLGIAGVLTEKSSWSSKGKPGALHLLQHQRMTSGASSHIQDFSFGQLKCLLFQCRHLIILSE